MNPDAYRAAGQPDVHFRPRPGAGALRLLREMDADPELRHVPVVLPGDGQLPEPVPACVRCRAARPVDLEQIIRIVESVQDIGLCIVTRGAEE